MGTMLSEGSEGKAQQAANCRIARGDREVVLGNQPESNDGVPKIDRPIFISDWE